MNAQVQQNDEVESTILVDTMDRVSRDFERLYTAWGVTALNAGGITVALGAEAGEFMELWTTEFYDSISTPLGSEPAPKDEGAKS